MADRHNGQIALPEVGEGRMLQVTKATAAHLETALGDFVFLDRLLFGLPRCSPKCLDLMLEHCVVEADGKPVKGAAWPDNVPLEVLAEKSLDAVAWCFRGMSHADWVEKTKAQAAPAGDKNPTNGTEA